MAASKTFADSWIAWLCSLSPDEREAYRQELFDRVDIAERRSFEYRFARMAVQAIDVLRRDEWMTYDRFWDERVTQ